MAGNVAGTGAGTVRAAVGDRVGIWRITGRTAVGEWLCEASTRAFTTATLLDKHLIEMNGMLAIGDDLTGATFGLLLVVGHAGGRDWEVMCSCGWTGTKRRSRLVKAQTWRCGNEAHARRNYERPEYQVWRAAVARCTKPDHPAWKNYGGRGIEMDPQWVFSFEAFFKHIGPRPSDDHTLERIDNDRGYVPGNVKWATWEERARNKRAKSTSRKIEWNGQTKTIAEWAETIGVTPEALRMRLDAYGWTIDRALTTTKRPGGRPRKS